MNDHEIRQAVAGILSKYSGSQDAAKASAPAADTDSIKSIVADILAASGTAPVGKTNADTVVATGTAVSPQPAAASGEGIFSTMDEAVMAARTAFVQYRHCSMQDRARFVEGLRSVFRDEVVLQQISSMAVEESGMGNVRDKVIKNRIAALKTPGLEDLPTQAISGDAGLTLTEFSPFGVIGSVTPTTNPTETIINNSIGMLAAGNTVVYSPHPRSRNVSAHCIRLINRRLAELGAPDNLVVTVEKPSMEFTSTLISHPEVNMIVATGGPGIVRTVMSSGKKAIGAGAGNPPVVVDETADIEKAATDIINGCSFDNNLPCIAEKEVIVVNEVADYLVHWMKKNGALLLTDADQIRRLETLVMNDKGTGPDTGLVGKSAAYILNKLGIHAPEDVRVILVETSADHAFAVHELMMPVLPVIRVADVSEAINLAVRLEHGNRHTAMMHSTDVTSLTRMAQQIQTTIFVKNGPSYAGIGVGGEGHTTFTIAGPTGEGLTSARSFTRTRRCVMSESLNVR